MNNNNLVELEGLVATFGDEEVDNSIREMNAKIQCEKGYQKLCKGCKSATPEAMKHFICDEISMGDEVFYCTWCGFIRNTGIDAKVMELIDSSKAKSKDTMNNNKYEDDGRAAMWELEDAGAFSDEGIMPGCHSDYWEYDLELEDVCKEYEDMEFVGKCIKIAREKAGLEIEDVSNALDLPESIIRYMENGYDSDYYDENTVEESGSDVIHGIVSAITPVAGPSAENMENMNFDDTRPWWEKCGDWTIREKIADYLSEVINPRNTEERKEIKNNNAPF